MFRTSRTTQSSIGRLDVAITLLAVALGTFLMYANVYEPDEGLDAPFSAIPAFLLVTVPVLWRSVDPLRALGAVIFGVSLHTAVFGELVRCGAAFTVLVLLTYAAGRRLQGRASQIGLALGLAGSLLVGAGDFLGFGVVVLGLPAAVVGWIVGRAVAARAPATGAVRDSTPIAVRP